MLNSVRNLMSLSPSLKAAEVSRRKRRSSEPRTLPDALYDASKILAHKREKHRRRRTSLISHWHVPYPTERSLTALQKYSGKVLVTFHTEEVVRNQMTIAKYIMTDTSCDSVFIIRLLEKGLFRIYFRGAEPLLIPETYNLANFGSLKNIIDTRKDLIHCDKNVTEVNILVQWKPILQSVPNVVVALPIMHFNRTVCSVVALTFKRKMPKDFIKKLPDLKMILTNLIPYSMLLQEASDFEDYLQRHDTINASLDIIETERGATGDPAKCAVSIGIELSKLVDCRTYSVMKMDNIECLLTRVVTVGKQRTAGIFGCIDSKSHEESRFKYDTRTPIGLAASTKKPLKWNDSSECKSRGMAKKQFHSVLFCTSIKNLLILPIEDYSGDKSLIIEFVDKEDGFTNRDAEVGGKFCRAVTFIYTVAVMGAQRVKNNKRHSILSHALLNIDPVKHVRVEQFIHTQRRASNVDMYTGRFLSYTFSIKTLPENEMNGAVIHIFYDLGFISAFKIRKTTLVRFLLTCQQGYRPLAYHNWQHACSVTHFVYIMIKNLNLVPDGILTVLETFALVVSALVHDIDHRGTNNRFQSCTNSELFQLYNTQESIMERHHLSIALSILRREDCNIIDHLRDEQYKDFLELMASNILATDIARYINTRDDNFKRLKDFKKDRKADRVALLSLMMTAADLSDCVKLWDDSLASVRQILAEFFAQGDVEKTLGMTPMSMMDRTLADIPEIEFNFISGIVVPVFRELAKMFPSLQSCMDTLTRSLQYWELSTAIFDAHWNVYDRLTILSYKDMIEENLKSFEKTVDKDLIRRFANKHEENLRRGTMRAAMSKLFSKKFRSRLKYGHPLLDNQPEEEMSSDNDAEVSNVTYDDIEEKPICGGRCDRLIYCWDRRKDPDDFKIEPLIVTEYHNEPQPLDTLMRPSVIANF